MAKGRPPPTEDTKDTKPAQDVTPAKKAERVELAARRHNLLDAAVATFLRYGLKKTSMDDVASAAGLSRQGLYLHFSTKEALFRAAVEHLIEGTSGAARAALAGDADLVDAIVDAFTALHGIHFTAPIAAEHMGELVEAAYAAVGDVVDAADAAVANALRKRLRAAGLGKSRERADTLVAAAVGLKHRRGAVLADYQRELRAMASLLVRS